MKKLLMAAAAITLMMTMTMLTSCTSEDDSPITSPEPEQLADYTILFYGNGGASLDEEILENLTQFYQGKTESYEHMNIVAQYKFSTEECLREFKYSTPEADKNYGSQSIRFVVEHDADKTYKNFDDILTQDMIYGEKNADLSCTDSLTNFINWAAKTYPAKHYMLILSDHGGGYVPHDELPEEVAATRGVNYDDGNDFKHFTALSLKRALSNAAVHMQTIYMDACLMNAIEYQYELKDLADYLILSTFVVPGYGGHYDYLVDLLATYPDDIETALSEYNRQVVSFWDEAMKQWVKNNYNDMSVIRTAALDAFGQNWKLFTDKLVAAYQSGDETVKQKINKVTEYIPRVCNSQPEFDLGDYYEGIHRIAPEVIDDAFYAELDESYKRTVVSKHNSEFLEKYGLIIDCSILVCTLGHYNCCNYEKDDNGDYQFSYFLTFYPDGSLYMLDHDTQTMKPNGTWGGTLESTYQQLAFDRATGWSRWLMINEQEPPYYSYADFNIDLPDLLNLK